MRSASKSLTRCFLCLMLNATRQMGFAAETILWCNEETFRLFDIYLQQIERSSQSFSCLKNVFYSKCNYMHLTLLHRIVPPHPTIMNHGILYDATWNLYRNNIETWSIYYYSLFMNLGQLSQPDIPSFSQALACWASKNLSIAWRKLLWKPWKLQHIVLRCRPQWTAVGSKWDTWTVKVMHLHSPAFWWNTKWEIYETEIMAERG